MLSWFFLVGAIIFEVAGTVSMKLADGFTRFWPSVFLFVFYGLSFIGLTLALKKIDVSMAYAVWSALGTAVVAMIGFFFFKEPMSPLKLISLSLIIMGVIGLRIAPA